MQQQVVKRRVKRDLIEIDTLRSKRSPRDRSDRPSKRAQTSNSSPKSRSLNLYLNDPKWTQMWYLVSHFPLSVYLLFTPLYLPASLCFCLPLFASVYFFLPLSTSILVSTSIYLSFYLYILQSLFPSLYLSLDLLFSSVVATIAIDFLSLSPPLLNG